VVQLEQAAGAAFEDGRMARQIPGYRGQRHTPGRYWSATPDPGTAEPDLGALLDGLSQAQQTELQRMQAHVLEMTTGFRSGEEASAVAGASTGDLGGLRRRVQRRLDGSSAVGRPSRHL
jgi:hypothetical protein